MPNNTQSAVTDRTQTWESLVDKMIEKIEGNGIPWNARQLIKEEFRKMAKTADKFVAYQKQVNKQETESLMERIIEISKPKFCGDTSVVKNAKVKIVGFKGEDADLNGLTGRTCDPFPKGYNATGMVGIKLFASQIVPARIENSEINIASDKLFFIE